MASELTSDLWRRGPQRPAVRGAIGFRERGRAFGTAARARGHLSGQCGAAAQEGRGERASAGGRGHVRRLPGRAVQGGRGRDGGGCGRGVEE
eukprot:scaffold2048_cov224-Pinguiococcus_pyrenoidosus.AAC.7